MRSWRRSVSCTILGDGGLYNGLLTVHDLAGCGSFGIIRKVKRKSDGFVSVPMPAPAPGAGHT
jgi:hypothetical protein